VGARKEFETFLLPKLADVLSETQKKAKVKNILQSMKKDNIICLNGRIWKKFRRF
jgi:ATP-dependent DNA helicase RecG